MRVLLYSAGDDAATWVAALRRALPAAHIDSWPAPAAQPPDYALVWKPPSELLGELARVKAIFNLGAGVDALVRAASLPGDVPLIRLEDAGMAEQMAEYVCHAVLRRYREFDVYAEQQRAGVWQPRPPARKPGFGVGVLGLGVLGVAVASALMPFGFALRGWSRTPKAVAGIASYVGRSELDAFLAGTQLLVCLLPLTRDTQGLLDRSTLSRLPRGACVVNVSRGALVVDADLLDLLDSGHLAAAMLDVFVDEPLPAAHRFWHHPRVALTPHVAAITRVEAAVAQIAAKIGQLEAGLPVSGVVARARGY
ncbi:MAG TPA: glyoxylate/hydroxypyruvate reductase A [Casimicrobiaceae bacterium]|nr:glyoxylate/hydroxypyruvate reductase A [Casimicrobiaceae bacterium]